MNRTKLIPKLIVLITLVAFTFSFIPTVQAGVPPFIQDLDFRDNLALPPIWNYGEWGPLPTYDASEEYFFRIGAVQTEEEEEEETWPSPPYRIRFYVEGKEIKLRRYAFRHEEYERIVYMWYQFFEPGFFPEGAVTLKWELWIKKPFQDFTENEWRIYIEFEYDLYFNS